MEASAAGNGSPKAPTGSMGAWVWVPEANKVD